MGKFHRLTAVLTTAVLAASLAACADDRPSAADAAKELAAGLSKLDVGGSAFTVVRAEDVTTDLGTITEALAPLKPKVAVDGVESTGEDTATATLDYVWDVDASDEDWTYSTSVELSREEDEWQAEWDPAIFVPKLRVDERLAREEIPADRGDITGANGEALVTQRPVLRVGIDKTKAPEEGQDAAARALAGVLELDPAPYAEQVAAAGAEAFVEAIVLREDSPLAADRAAIDAIPGAVALQEFRELAPTRSFARELLGTVGEPTAELIEQSGGKLQAGDITGLSGLQRQHNDLLAGTPGIMITGLIGEGDALRSQTLFTKPPVDGKPLATTLDAKLQTLAENTLAEEPSASSIVAIRPSTGEILTAANGPGSEGLPTALLGQYPPGSTFKIATTLALLRKGLTPESPTECPAELTVDGRSFNNASTYPAQFTGTIPLLQSFAQSCNTGFISNRDQVSQQELASAAADLGIGVEASIGTPAFFGVVPTEAEGTAHAASMIGQGEILVSPLALATMAASVGKGARVTPTVLAGGQDDASPSDSAPSASPSASSSASPSSGPSEDASKSTNAPAEPSKLTAEEAATLRTLMRAVVTEGGAGMLAGVPGDPVHAKTGTAEFGSETPPRTHAWIVALQGDLAVAVFVEEGELGSTSGGPLMEAFLRGAGS
ncbi:penicillin-binding transpeptidase domain-containing protein [uncultured Arthrobacter sp.]|uniref:penicillin-binding transpeptidase domain-containing protein n=1 Tax=uncultured Arthrobacter sp. TaxID=114050 RepID=UPI0025F52418|nr:penicillin-binding transpeptidase domain-containing protein [uncultured Arthrobacter sp.]